MTKIFKSPRFFGINFLSQNLAEYSKIRPPYLMPRKITWRKRETGVVTVKLSHKNVAVTTYPCDKLPHFAPYIYLTPEYIFRDILMLKYY